MPLQIVVSILTKFGITTDDDRGEISEVKTSLRLQKLFRKKFTSLQREIFNLACWPKLELCYRTFLETH
jgi:hypothetical protein